MNLVFPTFCILVAGAAGYIVEPQLESILLPSKASAATTSTLLPYEPDPAPSRPPGNVGIIPAIPYVPEAPPPPVKLAPIPEPVLATQPPTPAEPTTVAAPGEELLAPLPPLGDIGGANGEGAKDKAIVELMKESVKDHQVTEFTFEQVIGWKAGGKEPFDGDTYQVGLAACQVETIFGKKTLEAKALIKDGSITKWIWSKTKMEIR